MTERLQRKGMRLVWTCGVCGERAQGKRASVSVDERLVADVEQSHREAKDVMSAAELLAMPEAAPWVVRHDGCGEIGSYWFSLDRCRDLPELLGWTAHLLEKPWVRHTDWLDLIRSVARDS